MFTSIVVLTYNKLEYTQLCIDSIRRFTPRGSYELIVVENGSSDRTAEWLREQTDIRSIFLDTNAGATVALNEGLKIARGDNLMTINNDNVVTQNWLDNLTNCLHSAPDIGAVCPLMNYCSYWQAIPIAYRTMDEMQTFAQVFNAPDEAKWEERLKLIGVCMLIKREAFDRVGLFDELFNPGNFEDDDYSYRLRDAGYKLILCKDTFIHHFGSSTFGGNADRFRALLETNRTKFQSKWGFDTWAYSPIDFAAISNLHIPTDGEVHVLHVGCGCGATLLKVKDVNKQAKLYGIEENPNAARFAATFADIQVGRAEEIDLPYPEGLLNFVIVSRVPDGDAGLQALMAKLHRHLSPRCLVAAPRPV